MWKMLTVFGTGLTLILLILSCSTLKTEPPASSQASASSSLKGLVSTFPFLSAKNPPCLEMVREFCQTLFAPDAQGTLSFAAGEASYNIRMGQTANDFQEKDFEFLNTKLRAWKKLPADLKEILSYRNFKEKMKKYLSRSARQNMELADRVQTMRDEEEINSIWNLAVRETVLTRMEKSYPGYAKFKEDFIPLELGYESQRQRRILISQIARAMWSDHENWRKVERKFEKIREAYREVVQGNSRLSEEIKKDWIQRIKSIRLIIPGTDPEIDMEACFKTESNAYYFTKKNYITICAGDFNTEEIEQTLAHEIGHSLDLDRSRFLFQESSLVGQSLGQLKEMSCSKKPFSCEKWQKIKSDFKDLVSQSQAFSAQLPEFNSCLKDKETKDPIPEDYITRVAKEEVEASLSDLAQRNIFLRIISPKLPLPDGSSKKNPMYLNPCGYYLWDTQVHPLDEEASLLLFFTSEYRCSKEPIVEEKFKMAIETSKELQSILVNSQINLEGKFSARDRLGIDGYASSPTERFADNMGQLVFSKILSQESDLKKRRALYLANNAWLCRRPSIQQMFPKETKVQKNYYVEPHSETNQRQKELLTKEIRESLQCKQDFELNQCNP